jgi:hypothetical protein
MRTGRGMKLGFVRDRTDWLRDEAGSRVAYPITLPTAFGPEYHRPQEWKCIASSLTSSLHCDNNSDQRTE